MNVCDVLWGPMMETGPGRAYRTGSCNRCGQRWVHHRGAEPRPVGLAQADPCGSAVDRRDVLACNPVLADG
jgi:hypothetical protein